MHAKKNISADEKMYKKKIGLKVANVQPSQDQNGTYFLILKEIDGSRQLNINIGANEAQSMLITLRGIIPPRPLTHNLFASVLEAVSISLERVLIYQAVNDVYYAYMYLKTPTSILRVDSRTSDAVTLAVRMHAPIFVYENILDEMEAHIKGISEMEESLIQQESTSVLHTALQRAIESENYELAAKLRDILNQRNIL